MRILYKERQEILVAAARRELEGLIEVAPAEAGMHLVGWLPKYVNDKTAEPSISDSASFLSTISFNNAAVRKIFAFHRFLSLHLDCPTVASSSRQKF